MESKLDEMLRLRKAPGVSGVSDGPGSCANEFVFDRPDPVKEGQRILRMMEEKGQLRDPKMMRAAQIKMDALKNRPPEKVDYQKEGHPLDREPAHIDD